MNTRLKAIERRVNDVCPKEYKFIECYPSPIGFLKSEDTTEVWTDEELADATIVVRHELVAQNDDGVAMILDPRNDEPWKPLEPRATEVAI